MKMINKTGFFKKYIQLIVLTIKVYYSLRITFICTCESRHDDVVIAHFALKCVYIEPSLSSHKLLIC